DDDPADDDHHSAHHYDDSDRTYYDAPDRTDDHDSVCTDYTFEMRFSMRVPFVLIPIALTLAALPAAAQDAPRVIFCSGQCFTVDANGVRTPAPKGTQLREGQRIETGPGGYVQLKIGPDGAVGLSERGRARFERNVVILEDGRLRILGGEAFGRPTAGAPIELRTRDGSFVLSSADIEVKKTGGADATSNLTFMKVNAGDAR